MAYAQATMWIDALDRAEREYDILLTVDGKNFAPHELRLLFVQTFSVQRSSKKWCKVLSTHSSPCMGVASQLN